MRPRPESSLLDALYRAATAAAVVLAASRARRWALFWACAVLVVFSTGPLLLLAAGTVALTGALAWFDRRDRVLGALVGLLLSVIAFHLGSVGFHGLTSLAGVVGPGPTPRVRVSQLTAALASHSGSER